MYFNDRAIPIDQIDLHELTGRYDESSLVVDDENIFDIANQLRTNADTKTRYELSITGGGVDSHQSAIDCVIVNGRPDIAGAVERNGRK